MQSLMEAQQHLCSDPELDCQEGIAAEAVALIQGHGD